MLRFPRVILAALVAAAAASAVAGCTTTDRDAAAATATTSTRPATATSTFPEPPAYTHEVRGSEIIVWTTSADPTDLLNTYNTVARTLRGNLPDGGYWVRINCTTGSQGEAPNRLANGHFAVGKLGVAQTGDLGRFDGVVPGARCP